MEKNRKNGIKIILKFQKMKKTLNKLGKNLFD